MDKYIGRLLDNRYEILEIIGTGGMAVVYKARCHRLNRLVAIKILKDDYLGDEDFRSRFHSESQAVAMLSHPNIVSVYDVSTSVMADYIVMELIEGITLKQYMEKKGVLNWKETLHFAIQIGKALEHAHSRGIVHRDIKPHNIMVLKNGSVKVTDFGIARMMSKGNTLTKEALGSVHYISPEQAKGGRVDDRSDIYSLGTVMYEMIAGRPPYDGESPVAVAIQHINGGAVLPSVLNPNIPGGLEQIIVKAMQIEPGNRYAGATAMLRDMDEFRKDPAMLFDYDGTGGELIRVSRPPIVFDNSQNGRTTTAERVADRANGKVKQIDASNRTVTQIDSAKAREAARRRREEERRRNRITLIAVLVCILTVVIALVIIFAMAGSKITVPNLLGMNITDAEHNYPDLQFNILNEVYSEEYGAGEIVEQQPGVGEKVRKNSKVDVIVSIGPEETGEEEPETPTDEIKLTNLVGLDEEKARTLLLSYNLDIEIHTKPAFSDTYQKGKVMGMEPGEGTVLTQGSKVTLTISQGHQPKMEALKGKTEEFAIEYLEDLELNLTIKITTEYDEEVEKGIVISTDPEAGSLLDFGQRVEIVISAGSEVVKEVLPDVIGMDAFNAMQKLVNAGFKNVEREYTSSTISKDLVVDMSVESGKEYDVTTKIILYVSDGTLSSTPPITSGGKKVTINVPTAADLVDAGIVTEDGVNTVIVLLKQGDTVIYTSEPVTLGSTLSITLQGEGAQEYELYINNQAFSKVNVDFTANENS